MKLPAGYELRLRARPGARLSDRWRALTQDQRDTAATVVVLLFVWLVVLAIVSTR